jgi:limonene-1,2-epoxide hydrolase
MSSIGGLLDMRSGTWAIPVAASRAYVELMASTPTSIVQAWTEAVHKGDFDKARPLARENLHFRGPIDTFNRVDDFLAALKQLGGIVKGVEPEGMVANGNEVVVFYILKTVVGDAPVAEWYTVEGGKISSVRAYFDARPFAPPSAAPKH